MAICGLPIFDYEHVEGYGVTGHDLDHMTLLCPGHHREKTAGRLPVEVVRRASAAPFNRSQVFTAGHPLYFDGDRGVIEVGNARFAAVAVEDAERACGIMVDGAIVLGIKISDGHLRIDLNLRDADNRTIVRVRDGELQVAVDNWDVQFAGRSFRIREGFGAVVLDMEFDPPNVVRIIAARAFFNHVEIAVGRFADFGGVEVAGFVLSGVTIDGGAVSINRGRSGYPTGFALRKGPRHYGAPPAPINGAFSRVGPVEVWLPGRLPGS